jgi:hypothetical protein
MPIARKTSPTHANIAGTIRFFETLIEQQIARSFAMPTANTPPP